MSGESGKGREEKSDDQIRLCSHDAGFGCASRGLLILNGQGDPSRHERQSFLAFYLIRVSAREGGGRQAAPTSGLTLIPVSVFLIFLANRVSVVVNTRWGKQVARLCDGLLHIRDCFFIATRKSKCYFSRTEELPVFTVRTVIGYLTLGPWINPSPSPPSDPSIT